VATLRVADVRVSNSETPSPPPIVLSLRIGLLMSLAIFVGCMFGLGSAATSFDQRVRAAHQSDCTGAVKPDCLGTYRATIVDIISPDDATPTLLLGSAFFASSDQRDECFGGDCRSYVKIRHDNIGSVHTDDAVSVLAGRGRMERIVTAQRSFGTLDTSVLRALQPLPGLLSGLWFGAFFACLLVGYVVAAADLRIWTIPPGRWAAALGWSRMGGATGSVALVITVIVAGTKHLLSSATAGFVLLFLATLAVNRRAPTHAENVAIRPRLVHATAVRRAFRSAFIVLGLLPLWWAALLVINAAGEGTSGAPLVVGLVVGAVASVAATLAIRRALVRDEARSRDPQAGAHELQHLPDGSVIYRSNVPRVLGMCSFGGLAVSGLWVVATSHVTGGALAYATDFAIFGALTGLAVRSYWTATVRIARDRVVCSRMFFTRHWPLAEANGFTTALHISNRGQSSEEVALGLTGGRTARLRSIRWPGVTPVVAQEVVAALDDALNTLKPQPAPREPAAPDMNLEHQVGRASQSPMGGVRRRSPPDR